MSEWGSGPTQKPWGGESSPWEQQPARDAGDGQTGRMRKTNQSFTPERVSGAASADEADGREGKLSAPQMVSCVLLACYAGLPGILGAVLALRGQGSSKEIAKWCVVGLVAGVALAVAGALMRGETSATFTLLGFNPYGAGGRA